MSIERKETPAWLMRSISSYEAIDGTLRLEGGRLSFRAHGTEEPLFDVALADLTNVVFPRYNLGSVVRFDAGGQRYRVAFMASRRRWKWQGMGFRDIRPAWRWGREWRALLERSS